MQGINKLLVIRLNLDTTVCEDMYQKLLTNKPSPYWANKEDTDEIRTFLNSEDNNGNSFLVLAVGYKVNDTNSPAIEKICIAEASLEPSDGGYKIITKSPKEKTSSDNDLVVQDIQALLDLNPTSDFEKGRYLYTTSSKQIFERIMFYRKECTNRSLIRKSVNRRKSEESLPQDQFRKNFPQKDEYCERLYPETRLTEPDRLNFQIDYERIIHTKAFRRLVDKAQVFSSSRGDHFRTRMTHTQEVAQIARAISKPLGLNDQLTEAIALAHDIGHTPFGHQGERTLDDILRGRLLSELGLFGKSIKEADNHDTTNCHPNPYGGFKHNFQSVRVLSSLEESHIEFEGINPSWQVLEGTLWHTKAPCAECESCEEMSHCTQSRCCESSVFAFGESEWMGRLFHEDSISRGCVHSCTLEGQVVSIADEIAQRSHDLDDAFSAQLISVEELLDIMKLKKLEDLEREFTNFATELDDARLNGRLFSDEDSIKKQGASSLIIRFFIRNVIQASIQNINQSKLTYEAFENSGFRVTEKLIDFDESGKSICNYIEKLVTNNVLMSAEVSRFDDKARLVISDLFCAYYKNPRILPITTLRRFAILETLHPNEISDPLDIARCDFKVAHKEIERIHNADIYVLAAKNDSRTSVQRPTSEIGYACKKKLLVRLIADHIAGMTDSYAVKEHERIFNPGVS